jgi:hypothetical protein
VSADVHRFLRSNVKFQRVRSQSVHTFEDVGRSFVPGGEGLAGRSPGHDPGKDLLGGRSIEDMAEPAHPSGHPGGDRKPDTAGRVYRDPPIAGIRQAEASAASSRALISASPVPATMRPISSRPFSATRVDRRGMFRALESSPLPY